MKLQSLKPRVPLLLQRGPAQIDTRAETRTGWSATRARILTRDCGVCQCERCLASGDVKLASEVDHIAPLWAGGSNADVNLQAISATCHKLKTADEAKQRAALGLAPLDHWGRAPGDAKR
jgi:5-methylcytosine-specific restriction protein A